MHSVESKHVVSDTNIFSSTLTTYGVTLRLRNPEKNCIDELSFKSNYKLHDISAMCHSISDARIMTIDAQEDTRLGSRTCVVDNMKTVLGKLSKARS